MKLTPQQLPNHLAKQRLPLYWVSGDEPFLLAETCDILRQRLLNMDDTNKNADPKSSHHDSNVSRKIFHVDNQFSWQALLAEANSFSLFSQQQLLEVRLGNKKLVEPGRKLLHQYLQQPAPNTTILIMSAKLDAATIKTKWFQHIEKTSGFIQIWPLTDNALPAWIRTRLQRANLSADQQSVRLLAERGEGNLLALAQDIEKLSLLYPNSQLTVEQVAAAISDNARFDIFTLVDAAIAGDGLRALRILQQLRQGGIETILVLWALTRELRLLANVQSALQQGQPAQHALRNQGVWSKRIPLVQRALKRHDINHWQQLLCQSNYVDGMIKGRYGGNPWDELQTLVLAMAGINLLNFEDPLRSCEII